MWISGGKLWGVGIICNRKMEELFEKQWKFGGKSVRLCKQSYAQGNPQRWGLRVGINVWIMWISWEKNGGWRKGDEPGRGLQHHRVATWAGQLWANHQLRLCSRGSADPRESLRRCWISKLALTARKVLPEQKAEARFWVVNWGRIEWLCGRFLKKRAQEGLRLWEVILPVPF